MHVVDNGGLVEIVERAAAPEEDQQHHRNDRRTECYDERLPPESRATDVARLVGPDRERRQHDDREQTGVVLQRKRHSQQQPCTQNPEREAGSRKPGAGGKRHCAGHREGDERFRLGPNAESAVAREPGIGQQQKQQRRKAAGQRAAQPRADRPQEQCDTRGSREIRGGHRDVARRDRPQRRVDVVNPRRLLVPRIAVGELPVADALPDVGVQPLVRPHRLHQRGQADDQQCAGERQEDSCGHRGSRRAEPLEL